MTEEQVQEMIKKHEELLDSMTEEERIQYYKAYGIIIEPKNNEEEKSRRR